MSIIEEVSWMSKSGYNDRELLEYIDKHYDEQNELERVWDLITKDLEWVVALRKQRIV